MNNEQFTSELERSIKAEFGGRFAAAAEWGITPQFLGAVINGKKPVPLWLADKMGFERKRILTYTFNRK